MHDLKELIATFNSYGLLVNDLNLRINGKIARCGTKDKPKSKNGWYVVYTYNDLINACFGDFRSGEGTQKWCNKHNLSSLEKSITRKNMNIFRENFEKEGNKTLIKIRQDFASFDLLKHNHRYLANKGISELLHLQLADPIKVLCDSIIIPIRDFNGLVTGYQQINSAGNKRYAYGSQKAGNYYLLSPAGTTFKDCDIVFIGEGFATMASVYLSLGTYFESKTYGSIAAFDVHNIKAVVQTILENSPAKEIVLIADNDAEKSKNIGVETCKEIEKLYKNIKVVLPTLP